MSVALLPAARVKFIAVVLARLPPALLSALTPVTAASFPANPFAAEVKPLMPTPPVSVEQRVPTCSIRNTEIAITSRIVTASNKLGVWLIFIFLVINDNKN